MLLHLPCLCNSTNRVSRQQLRYPRVQRPRASGSEGDVWTRHVLAGRKGWTVRAWQAQGRNCIRVGATVYRASMWSPLPAHGDHKSPAPAAVTSQFPCAWMGCLHSLECPIKHSGYQQQWRNCEVESVAHFRRGRSYSVAPD